MGKEAHTHGWGVATVAGKASLCRTTVVSGTTLVIQHLFPFMLQPATQGSLTHPISGKEGSPRKPPHLPGTVQLASSGASAPRQRRKEESRKGAFSWLFHPGPA